MSSVIFRRRSFSCGPYTLLHNRGYLNASEHGGWHESLFQLLREHVETFLGNNRLFGTLLIQAPSLAHTFLAIDEHVEGYFVQILQQIHAVPMNEPEFIHLRGVVD